MNFLKNLGQLLRKKQAPAVEAPKELAKRTMKLVSKKEMVDLGVTKVLLKFSDGRELITNVYGSVSYTFENGYDEGEKCYIYPNNLHTQTYYYAHIRSINLDYIFTSRVLEPSAEEKTINSVKAAEQFISNIGSAESSARMYTADSTIYVDCPRVPTKSEVGKVITATILSTHQHLEEVTKYSVEKI